MVNCIGIEMEHVKCWWCGQSGAIQIQIVKNGIAKKSEYQHGLCAECAKGGRQAVSRRCAA